MNIFGALLLADILKRDNTNYPQREYDAESEYLKCALDGILLKYELEKEVSR